MSESFRNVSMGIILNIFFLLQEPTLTTIESKKKYIQVMLSITKNWVLNPRNLENMKISF